MAYSEELAMRVRKVLARRVDLDEKKMFGGLAFLLGGKMACGIIGEELMVRVGPEGYAAALAEPHVRPMDFTGRPMTGMVYVAPPGFATDEALAGWVERGVRFVDAPEAAPKRRAPSRASARASARPRSRR